MPTESWMHGTTQTSALYAFNRWKMSIGARKKTPLSTIKWLMYDKPSSDPSSLSRQRGHMKGKPVPQTKQHPSRWVKIFSTTLKGNTLRKRGRKTPQKKITSTIRKVITPLTALTPPKHRERNRTAPLAGKMKTIPTPTATIQDCD